MSGNRWDSRLLVGLVFLAVQLVHQNIVADVSNTPLGMFAYHGSAALCDFLLIVVSAHALRGSLSDNMQTLCLMSMIVNFTGWLLYMAYAPPIIYNTMMAGLSYAQYIRLLFVDNNDAHTLGNDLVRRHHSFGAKLLPKEANQ